jgi:hypothetical protein
MRPAFDLARRHLGHQRLVSLHPLAVKRRQQQLALLHVRVLVEQQHGVLAEHGQQDPVGLAGVDYARVAGEHLPQVLRVRKHHPRVLVEDPQREGLTEASGTLIEHPLGLREPDRGLQRLRHPRTGRQLHPPGARTAGAIFVPRALVRVSHTSKDVNCEPIE